MNDMMDKYGKQTLEERTKMLREGLNRDREEGIAILQKKITDLEQQKRAAK